MGQLTDEDFTQLEDCDLAWRWTSAAHDLLPADELQRIRPLSRAAAEGLAPMARARFAIARPDASFPALAENDAQIELAQNQLAELPIDAEARVLVFWSSGTAVATDWSLFVRHWSSFCYPASDDVAIWSDGTRWALAYRHFEQFDFAAELSAA